MAQPRSSLWSQHDSIWITLPFESGCKLGRLTRNGSVANRKTETNPTTCKFVSIKSENLTLQNVLTELPNLFSIPILGEDGAHVTCQCLEHGTIHPEALEIVLLAGPMTLPYAVLTDFRPQTSCLAIVGSAHYIELEFHQLLSHLFSDRPQRGLHYRRDLWQP